MNIKPFMVCIDEDGERVEIVKHLGIGSRHQAIILVGENRDHEIAAINMSNNIKKVVFSEHVE